jgi:AcrR family transcriptional regulator
VKPASGLDRQINQQDLMQRKSSILVAAHRHFAQHGFRGASLRDIARDAGVSLTLLNHHFGSKHQLMAAVIACHRTRLDEWIRALEALRSAPTGTAGVRDLVQTAIRIGFEMASDDNGREFLQLIARVTDDPSELSVQDVRESLDHAARVFMDALQQFYPDATRHAAASAYLCASGALSRFLAGAGRLKRLAPTAAPLDRSAENEARLAVFLVAGIEAAMQSPSMTDADSLEPLAIV